MSADNVKVVREAVESFLTGDGERTAQLIDPEVQFHGTVGGLEEGRIAHGLPEIMASFEADDLERGRNAAWCRRGSSTPARTSSSYCTSTVAAEAAASRWNQKPPWSVR